MLSLITFSPLIGVAAALLLRGRTDERSLNAVRWIALATTLFTLALSGLMLAQFDAGSPGYQFVERFPLFGGFNYAMGVDGISILFVVLTAFLMPLCVVASWGIKERVTEYMIAFLVLETLVIGVFTALDMLLFYLFFEGGLIPMFLIIGIWGGKNRIYAAYKFFLYTLLGSILMLGAMLYMVALTGTSSIPVLAAYDFGRTEQFWLFAAFFASFAVKMPMWPVHTWLPDAHVEASPPAPSFWPASCSSWAATASSASACRCSRTPPSPSDRWCSRCRSRRSSTPRWSPGGRPT